jgi:hypothetical protein
VRKTDGLLKLIGLCVLAGVLVAGVLFPVVGTAGVVSNKASETVDKTSSDLADIPPPLVTTVTDSAGNPIATLYDQYRLPVAANQINEAMQWALVSIEDRRFYDHQGVDWKGTLRAAVSNGGGGNTQGASTLTQQYVKNYLINIVYRNDKIGQQKAQEQSIARKLKEARIAIQLETKMSKAQVLAGYLNIVEFSRQIYGVGAAAQAYFNTTPEKLTVPQAALLAGLVNNPTVFDPWNHPDRATQRRNLVLDRMVDNQKLAPADAARFKAEPLGVVADGPQKPAANCIGAGAEAGFFCQYAEDYLLKAGIPKDDLYAGGYTIRTTLDQKANHEAKVSAEAQVDKTQPNVANTLSLVRPGKNRHEVVALVCAAVWCVQHRWCRVDLQDLHDGRRAESGCRRDLQQYRGAPVVHLARVHWRCAHLPVDRVPTQLQLVLRRQRRRLQRLRRLDEHSAGSGQLPEHRVRQPGRQDRQHRARNRDGEQARYARNHGQQRGRRHGRPQVRRQQRQPEPGSGLRPQAWLAGYGRVHPRLQPAERSRTRQCCGNHPERGCVVPTHPDRFGHRPNWKADSGQRSSLRTGRA